MELTSVPGPLDRVRHCTRRRRAIRTQGADGSPQRCRRHRVNRLHRGHGTAQHTGRGVLRTSVVVLQ